MVDSRLRVRPIVGDFGAPRYTAVSPGRRLAYVTDSERQRGCSRGVGRPSRHRPGARRWSSPTPRDRPNGQPALGCTREQGARNRGAEPRRASAAAGRRDGAGGLFLAHDVGFTPGGRRVWVTSGDRGRIAIYDARTGGRVRTIAADAPPQHVTFVDDRAFVTSGDDGVLRIHALDGRRVGIGCRSARLLQRAAGLRDDPDPIALAGNALLLQRRGASRSSGLASRAPRMTPASSSSRDWTSRAAAAVESLHGRRPRRAHLRARRPAGVSPRGSRRSSACTGRGHIGRRTSSSTTRRPPRTSPRRRSLLPCATLTTRRKPPVRAVAASNRGQPCDRLGTGAAAAGRGGARRRACGAWGYCAARRLAARCARRAAARPPRSDRPQAPARVHAG